MEKNISTDVLEFEVINPPDDVAKKHKLTTESFVFYTKRLRKIDNLAHVVETAYFPIKLFPDITKEVLNGSVNQFIEKNMM